MKQLIIVPVIVGMAFISLSLNSGNELESKNEIEFVNEADTDPTFPGGNEAYLEFFKVNFVYPKEAIEKNSEGKVYVKFIVEKSGKIKDVKILRGTEDESLNQSAINFIKKMPNWIPAVKNNEKVDAEVTIPINFTLAS